MRMFKSKFSAGVASAVLMSAALGVATLGGAYAAGLWPNFPVVGGAAYCSSYNQPGGPGTPQQCTNNVPAGPPVITGLEQVPVDTHTAGGGPQTALVPVGLLANLSGTPKNYLDNGALNVQQRGTGIVTCGTTTTAVYGADRWACQANVTSGAGRSSLVTTAALLPAGFSYVNELYRTSGALTQPVCTTQEIPTRDSVALAGKTVTLSVWEVALAGLAADNGNLTTLSIIYGTGTDEGIQTPTASPAITPAWTGIAFAVNQQNVSISTTPARYSVTGTIPATATEVGVMICFTPTATGAGTTDGFAWTGAQLEVAPSMTAFDVHPLAYDLSRAQRYYWQWAETASSTADSPFLCSALSSTVAVCKAVMHEPFRAAPTIACTAGTLKRMVAGSDTTVSACAAAATTNGVAGVDNVTITATVASGDTAGFSGSLMSGNSTGGGLITASADF